MSTMTLEQMIEWFAGKERLHVCYQNWSVSLDEEMVRWFRASLDALLRERESAKAAVTDDVMEVAMDAYDDHYAAEVLSSEIGSDNHSEALRAALEAIAPMLASARVPDEKEDLDPVRLRREGRVATEWERGFNEGWNDCRDAMLAAAGEPNHDA